MASNIRVLSSSSLSYLRLTGNNLEVRNGCRTISLQSISSGDSDETIEVPDVLNSIQSLKFCGFSDEAAAQICGRWEQMSRTLAPGDLGYGQHVVELARQYVSQRKRVWNAFVESDDWDGALRSLGVKNETRRAIMDPNFENLRLSASASEWVLSTVNSCWDFLDGLDSQVRKSKEAQELRASSPDASIKPSKAIKPGNPHSPLHSGSSRLQLAVESEPPQTLPDKSIIYKGGDWARLTRIFNPDGSLDVSQILSRPPCDFHPSDLDLYFTKQEDIARQYAEYAQRRTTLQAGVLTVAIPKAWLANATEVYGEDWKTLIWESRNEKARAKNFGRLPKDVKWYEDCEILLGSICYQSTDQISRLESKNDLEVLRSKKGEKGTQVVLKGNLMGEEFVKEYKGFVWIGDLASPKKAKHFA